MAKITILGRGKSFFDCPFDTEEIWATLTCLITDGMYNKPYTKLFYFDTNFNPAIEEALEEARTRGITVVSTYDYADEKYPLKNIVKYFNSNYLKPTVSYMIALALYEGYQHLKIYGIDQGPEHHYLFQRPYIAYWVGVANYMLGGKVNLAKGSWLYLHGSEREVRHAIEGNHSRQIPSAVHG